MIRDPRDCTHPPNLVTADICEGDARWNVGGHAGSIYWVSWCRVCGSYYKGGEWLSPLERLPEGSGE